MLPDAMRDGNAAPAGVQCRAMSADAATFRPPPTKPVLPAYADYFRAVVDLGKRTIRPAMPALALLYFYRLGMGIYMAFSPYSGPSGFEAERAIVPMVLSFAGLLPMLLLVYTPFLPLQDHLLRGESIGFLRAVRDVLEVAWNYMISGIAQSLIAFTPLLVVVVITAAVMPDGEGLTAGGAQAALAGGFFLLTTPIAFLWALLASYFLVFATPGIVLNGEGPIHSVKSSWGLVRRNFGPLLGRLLLFAVLAIAVYVFALIPSAFLTAMERASDSSATAFKIAGAIWSSAIDALLIPFWVASIMVLYRTLVPRAATAASGAPAGVGQAPAATDDGIHTAANPLLFE